MEVTPLKSKISLHVCNIESYIYFFDRPLEVYLKRPGRDIQEGGWGGCLFAMLIQGILKIYSFHGMQDM